MIDALLDSNLWVTDRSPLRRPAPAGVGAVPSNNGSMPVNATSTTTASTLRSDNTVVSALNWPAFGAMNNDSIAGRPTK
jgi:hypothetical protein